MSTHHKNPNHRKRELLAVAVVGLNACGGGSGSGDNSTTKKPISIVDSKPIKITKPITTTMDFGSGLNRVKLTRNEGDAKLVIRDKNGNRVYTDEEGYLYSPDGGTYEIDISGNFGPTDTQLLVDFGGDDDPQSYAAIDKPFVGFLRVAADGHGTEVGLFQKDGSYKGTRVLPGKFDTRKGEVVIADETTSQNLVVDGASHIYRFAVQGSAINKGDSNVTQSYTRSTSVPTTVLPKNMGPDYVGIGVDTNTIDVQPPRIIQTFFRDRPGTDDDLIVIQLDEDQLLVDPSYRDRLSLAFDTDGSSVQESDKIKVREVTTSGAYFMLKAENPYPSAPTKHPTLDLPAEVLLIAPKVQDTVLTDKAGNSLFYDTAVITLSLTEDNAPPILLADQSYFSNNFSLYRYPEAVDANQHRADILLVFSEPIFLEQGDLASLFVVVGDTSSSQGQLTITSVMIVGADKIIIDLEEDVSKVKELIVAYTPARHSIVDTSDNALAPFSQTLRQALDSLPPVAKRPLQVKVTNGTYDITQDRAVFVGEYDEKSTIIWRLVDATYPGDPDVIENLPVTDPLVLQSGKIGSDDEGNIEFAISDLTKDREYRLLYAAVDENGNATQVKQIDFRATPNQSVTAGTTQPPVISALTVTDLMIPPEEDAVATLTVRGNVKTQVNELDATSFSASSFVTIANATLETLTTEVNSATSIDFELTVRVPARYDGDVSVTVHADAVRDVRGNAAEQDQTFKTNIDNEGITVISSATSSFLEFDRVNENIRLEALFDGGNDEGQLLFSLKDATNDTVTSSIQKTASGHSLILKSSAAIKGVWSVTVVAKDRADATNFKSAQVTISVHSGDPNEAADAVALEDVGDYFWGDSSGGGGSGAVSTTTPRAGRDGMGTDTTLLASDKADVIFADGSGGGGGTGATENSGYHANGGAAGSGDDTIYGGGGNDIIFGDGFAGSKGVKSAKRHRDVPGGAGGFGGGGGGGASAFSNNSYTADPLTNEFLKFKEGERTANGPGLGGIGGGDGGYLNTGLIVAAIDAEVGGTYSGVDQTGVAGESDASPNGFGGGGGGGAGGSSGGNGSASGVADEVPEATAFDSPVQLEIPDDTLRSLLSYADVREAIDFDGVNDDARVWGADAQTQGHGDDVLHGGAGNDVLIGGGGNDTFVLDFESEDIAAIERILDWGNGTGTADRLQIVAGDKVLTEADITKRGWPTSDTPSGTDLYGDYLQYGFVYQEHVIYVRLYSHHDGDASLGNLYSDLGARKTFDIDSQYWFTSA